MAKKNAKKEASKKIVHKKAEKKSVKKTEPKKMVKVEKKAEKKNEKKHSGKKLVKKIVSAVKKAVSAPLKSNKKEIKKPHKVPAKIHSNKKPEIKKIITKSEVKISPKKTDKVVVQKPLEKKSKEASKEVVTAVTKDKKIKEPEDKKLKKTKTQEGEDVSKKAGRPAKETPPEDDLVGASDDGEWEEEDIDLGEIESEKRNFTIDSELKDILVGDILSRADGDSLKEIFTSIRDPKYFTSGVDECIERNCDNPATTSNFCRLHYVKNWVDIKKKLQILSDGKLQDLIENLVSKHPVKYIEAMLQDLGEEKVFLSVLKELNIEAVEESFDDELEDDDDSDIAFETKTTFKAGTLGEED